MAVLDTHSAQNIHGRLQVGDEGGQLTAQAEQSPADVPGD